VPRCNYSITVCGARGKQKAIEDNIGGHINRKLYHNNIFLSASNCFQYSQCARSQDSVVGIATSNGLDDRGIGVRVPVGSRIFSTQPSMQWVPGVKRPGREVDHTSN
jgi:hypothetical protein